MTGAANFAKYEAKIFRPLTWKITDGMRLLLSGQTVQRFASHRSAVMKPPSWRPARHLTVLPQPASKPQDVSFDYAAHLADEMRGILRSFPEVKQVVSQVGRPDDGTDTTTFNNIEFQVDLKPQSSWKTARSKDDLIQMMNEALSSYPGVAFNFSQNIQDNVEEAMSGVKGENSLKLFGDDIGILAKTAAQIEDVMAAVPGIADLSVFKESGQPNLLIS